jgi:hypothetical protein
VDDAMKETENRQWTVAERIHKMLAVHGDAVVR